MTTTDTAPRTARVAGVFYLLTFASIPTLALYAPLREPGAQLGSGVLWGTVLELVVGVACIGTAVALYPVLRRQDEGLALGFVAARVLEAAMIFVGVASLLALAALNTGSAAFVALYDSAFLVGQSLIPGLNALLLGTLLYRSRLVPRWLPTLALIGGPLQILSVLTTVLGINDRTTVWTLVAVAPIIVWELSLGVYLVVRGLRPGTVTP